MMLNIFQVIDGLEKSLSAYFSDNPFVFKGAEKVDNFTPARPYIYKFIVPTCDRNEQNFPQKVPSIALIVDSLSEEKELEIAQISAHIAVVCPSICDKEKVEYDPKTGAYSFKEGSDFTQTQAYNDLYLQCLQLGVETRTALQRASYTAFHIVDIGLNLPDSSLPDFPYSTCSVTFKVASIPSYRKQTSDFTKYL